MTRLERILIFLIPTLILLLFIIAYIPWPTHDPEMTVKGVFAQTQPAQSVDQSAPTEEDYNDMMNSFKAVTTIIGGAPVDETVVAGATPPPPPPVGGGEDRPPGVGPPTAPTTNANGLENYGDTAYRLSESNKTYDGVVFDRCLFIEANNVTVKNSTITGSCSTPVINDNGNGNVFDHNTITGGGPETGAGILCSNCKILNNDISRTADGIKLTSNQEVRGNFIHNLAQGIGAGGTPTHNDGMQSQGGSNVIIDGNTIDGNTCPPSNVEGCNGAIYLQPTGSSPITGYTITNNRITGNWPYFGIYLHPGSGAGINATISNNTCVGSFLCVKTL